MRKLWLNTAMSRVAATLIVGSALLVAQVSCKRSESPQEPLQQTPASEEKEVSKPGEADGARLDPESVTAISTRFTAEVLEKQATLWYKTKSEDGVSCKPMTFTKADDGAGTYRTRDVVEEMDEHCCTKVKGWTVNLAKDTAVLSLTGLRVEFVKRDGCVPSKEWDDSMKTQTMRCANIYQIVGVDDDAVRLVSHHQYKEAGYKEGETYALFFGEQQCRESDTKIDEQLCD